MEIVRASSVGEFASWYLARERRERKSGPFADSADPIGDLRAHHPGKWRAGFEEARWSLARLSPDEFGRLIFMESDWSVAEGLVVPGLPDYRLLRTVAQRAEAIKYLDRPTAGRHREYRERLSRGMLMSGDNVLVVRSATKSERETNPNGTFYLHDGAGRSLPYMILVAGGELPFGPVEAFLADGDFG